jgi:hypothetical protein
MTSSSSEPQPARQPQPQVRPVLAGDVPDRVERVLDALGDAHAAPQRAHDADHQADARALDAADAVLDLPAGDGELGGDRVDDPLLQRRVAGQGVAEQGDEHQQQREQGQEAVVGEQGRVLAGLVVAELPDHPHLEAEHAVPLLEAVDRPQHPLDPLHRSPRRASPRPPSCDGAGRATISQPRPSSGISVAITVMNSTLAWSGRLAM